MDEIKVKYETITKLFDEIVGVVEEDKVKFKGVLSQMISNVVKYDLTEYVKELRKVILEHETKVNEFFDKYGEDTPHEGKIFRMIQKFIKDKDGNDTETYTEEFILFNKIIETEYSTYFNRLKKNDLDFKSEESYPTVYEFLIIKESN